jgi:predicted DNA-binding transcriptional regulator YafY
MSRSTRLFEIIQILRAAARPITADHLALKLEVSTRTIYRDIASLQAMQTPIDGEAGIGYMMRRGYDLPPLNFDQEEIEALRVGLLLLSRTGDSMLQKAAARIFEKVDVLHGPADWLQVTPWGAPNDDPERGCVSISMLREAIRDEHKLELTYRDENDIETLRIVRPIALSYRSTCILLAGWCELRTGLRHFRTDRVYGCNKLDDQFVGQGHVLRELWLTSYREDESNR